jgi:hypothetical protein
MAVYRGWFALLVILSVADVQAQTSPQLGRIRVGTVTVRTGPGEAMPACGSLEQGSIVIVDHPEGAEWYAIQPPPGSLSWINHLYLELRNPTPGAPLRFPLDGVVNTEGEIKIAAGMMGEAKPLNVQRTKLPQGSIVRVVGPKVRVQSEDSESYWYPITPPRGDFRYLSKVAVELIGAERGGFVVQSEKVGGNEAGTALPAPGTGLLALPNPERTLPAAQIAERTTEPNHPLWTRATQAERDGNWELAEQLYKQLADEQTRPNGDTKLVNLCYLRIQQIREAKKKQFPINNALANRNTDAPTPTGGVAAKVFSEGVLRATSVKIGGQKGYALTSQRGEVWVYVVAEGIELDRYIGRWVELRGAVTYPSNLSGIGLLAATQIESVK